ncbi:hypothetical protein BT93_L1769 [Corymbia citriodora subsp. variegata]|uniref:AAA+ ATPase domain-containing protein n=1 Tax=Corymbia citriodora subsp. variegata TaxID=360336 RepID=A0A8T0CRE1_CORYI|nr:hypothetical protein BT93_L1769 [Corymbia citriodora subsp. variegata]
MVDIVVSVAAKVAEYLVAPVCRQCGYVIFTNSNVGQLKVELDNLEGVKDGVQRSVVHAENNLREIKPEVNRWKNNAENVANEAHGVLDNFAKLTDGRAKKTCSCGWLPNPKERYCLGRNARKTVEAIQALIPQGKFERVYCESAPPGRVGSPPDVNLSAGGGGNTIIDLGLVSGPSDVNSSAADGGDTIADSRASIIQGIMEALDDEKLKVIGIYGPGGVGKTTMLEEVEKKLRKDRRPFHMIVKAKVSQIPVLKNIQDEIADDLKLDLKDLQSESGRGNRLRERLQKDPSEKVLIILDDIWEELDLKAVGIPSGDTSGKCKLLLTSRFHDVLEQKMLADLTFRIEGLNDDEAFRLFEKTVGDKLVDEELKRIAPEVVKKLAGLPLLIISVASTLKNSGVYAWKNALTKLDAKKMETIVKMSYDHLENEDAQSLFLLCGLMGGTIQVETLLGLGMGLDLFDGYNRTIQDSRYRLNTLLDSLRSICLLQDGGDDEKNVTIHDLYSEMVVSTPIKGQNFLMMNNNYGPKTKEKLKKCWAICLVDVGCDRLAELTQCAFPKLKILMLSLLKHWGWEPMCRCGEGDSYRLDFTYMKELRVLYLCSMDITTSLCSIEILGNLGSLYLDQCDVGDVVILGKLKTLQILSFAGSTISKLPKEIGDLMNLRLLNLSYCKDLKIIEPGALKGLINLEELHMRDSFVRWMGVDEIQSKSCNARLAELKSLTKLMSVEILIRDPTVLMEDDDLPCGNLINFWIQIGDGWFGMGYEGLRTMILNLEGCDHILSREWIKKTLHNTQYLCLHGMRKFKKNAHELCIGGFPTLKHLDIKDSASIKYIASSSDGAFPNLESLSLTNLINLEKICHDCVDSVCFSKLKIVSVSKCNKLKYLWCLSQMQRLVQMEEIFVGGCHSMQAISTEDAGKDFGSIDNMVELPNVRLLELVDLPNMTSFCTTTGITSEGAPLQAVIVDEERVDEGTELVTTTSDLQDTYSNSFFDRKVSLLDLEELSLNSGGSFKRIWHDELSRSSFCKLATITLESCFDLLHIFLATIIERLHNLKSVEVENCPSLKSLFDCGSLDSNMEQTRVLLPELVSIDIESCPSLESLFNCGSFDSNSEHKIVSLPKLEEVSVSGAGKLRHVVMSNSQTVFGFPSLKTVSVENCSDLRYLFPNHTATTLGKLEKLKITKCKHMKEVIPEKEVGRSEAEVSFPNIRKLEIEGAQCKELWNNQIPNDSFCKLEFLELNHCANLLHIARSHMLKRLQHCLKEVRVISCHSIETIFEGDGVDTGSGKLRKLVLSHLDNLTHIWQCNGLSIGGQIKDIIVEHCRNMKAVIMDEGGRDGGIDDVIEFSLLQKLRIYDCPTKKFFSCPYEKKESVIITLDSQDACADSFFNRKVSFPNMEQLEIEGAQCKELWNSQIPTNSFLKLRSLELKNCDNLQRIGPSHLWRRLQHCLKVLEVESCRSIEIIYEGDETNAEGGILRRLILCDLENLRHIWQSDGLPNVPFPNLRSVQVVRCPLLKILFTTFTAKFLEQMRSLVVKSCEHMEHIAGHEISEEVTRTTITFSMLVYLGLIELPNFKSFFLLEKYSPKFEAFEDFPCLGHPRIESCGKEPDYVLNDFWDPLNDFWEPPEDLCLKYKLVRRRNLDAQLKGSSISYVADSNCCYDLIDCSFPGMNALDLSSVLDMDPFHQGHNLYRSLAWDFFFDLALGDHNFAEEVNFVAHAAAKVPDKPY